MVFSSLAKPEVEQVAALMFDEVVERCVEQGEGLRLQCSPQLKAAVVEQGYSPTYGARPLRRAVQRLVEDPVAEAVLDGFCTDGSLELDVDRDGSLVMRNGRGQRRAVPMRSGAGIEDDWQGAPELEPTGAVTGEEASPQTFAW